MSQFTREVVEQVLGEVDDNVYSAITISGASLRDIAKTQSFADGTNDIAGQGEQAICRPVTEILTILSGQSI